MYGDQTTTSAISYRTAKAYKRLKLLHALRRS
jgi:hypothetical protein